MHSDSDDDKVYEIGVDIKNVSAIMYDTTFEFLGEMSDSILETQHQ